MVCDYYFYCFLMNLINLSILIFADKRLSNVAESSSALNDVALNTTRVTASGSDISIDQRENVREFLEELLSTLIGGGPLDDITVGQMFKHNECKYPRLLNDFGFII